MELEKFDPVCAAVLKKTEIEKPAYPVIDFHMHMGKMLLGESYETKYGICPGTARCRRCMRCEYGWIFRKRSGKDAKETRRIRGNVF